MKVSWKWEYFLLSYDNKSDNKIIQPISISLNKFQAKNTDSCCRKVILNLFLILGYSDNVGFHPRPMQLTSGLTYTSYEPC